MDTPLSVQIDDASRRVYDLEMWADGIEVKLARMDLCTGMVGQLAETLVGITEAIQKFVDSLPKTEGDG